MLSIELERLQNDPSELQNRVQELRKQMSEISTDVQALSHDLHSSKLEYLGVAAGMKSCCKEFSERQKLEIDFRREVPGALPFEGGLSLFRVLFGCRLGRKNFLNERSASRGLLSTNG
jgi:signal transduction histidine kinase